MKLSPLRIAIPAAVLLLASSLCRAEKPADEPAPEPAVPAAAAEAVPAEGHPAPKEVQGGVVVHGEARLIEGGVRVQARGGVAVAGPGEIVVQMGEGVIEGGVVEIQANPAQVPGPGGGVIRVGRGAVVVGGEGRVIVRGGGDNQVFIQGDQGVAVGVTEPGAGTPAAKPEEPRSARVEFVNGDRLQGTLESLDGATGLLHWRHADSGTPIPFKRSGVARITLPARAGAAPSTNTFGSTVALTNGDFMRGRVVALDAESLTLETERCGTFRFERLMVEFFSPDAEKPSLLYAGPFGLEGWTQQPMGARRGATTGWRFSRGALVCAENTPISRPVGALPDKFKIAFKAEWSQYPGFQLMLLPRPKEGGGIAMNGPVLMVSGSSLHWRRAMDESGVVRGRGGMAWNVNMENFRHGPGALSLEVLGDKSTSDLMVVVNGKVIRTWNDPSFFKANLEGIGFQSHTNVELRFSEIRVMAWDGVPPGAAETKDEKSALDRIYLVNGDELVGEVVSVGAGNLRLRSELTGEVEIPVRRVSAVRFSPESRERARRRKEDARLVWSDGGVLTATLESVAAGKMKLSSENFGKAESPFDLLSALDFNLYQRAGAAAETGEP